MTVDALPVGADYPTAMVERLVGACEAIKALAERRLGQLDLEPADVARLTDAAAALETAWLALSLAS